VRVHVTFFLLLLGFGYFFYSQGGWLAAVQGIIYILLLFVCVLLHEFGHAIAAKAYGIRTPDITLLPIGGLARLERMPDKPYQELVVALAGPAVNIVIACGLLVVIVARGDLVRISQLDAATVNVDMIILLFVVNLILVVFNMVPAFPMDGGRVFRALLAMRMNYARATQIAATTGQGMAILFVLLGIFWSPMLILIAVFVYLGASQEATFANMRELSKGLPVASAMITHFDTLNESDSLDVAAEALIRTSQHDFPVLDENGVVLGVLTRQAMIKGLKASGGDAGIADLIHRDLPTVTVHSRFDRAFQLMHQAKCSALPVVDFEGKLVGLITTENVGEMMMINSALGRDGVPPWRKIS